MPIGVLLAIALSYIGLELVQSHRKKKVAVVALHSSGAILRGLQRALPLVCLVTFVLVPSISTRIFETFICKGFEYDASGATRRYLSDDLDMSCDDDEYMATRSIAMLMAIIWPFGTPVIWAVLLWASRDAIRTNRKTHLSRATAFLSGDYTPEAFWWEPVEMCRKLLLVGWVVLIDEEAVLARVLVALLVSMCFLVLHITLKPLKRCAVRGFELGSVRADSHIWPRHFYSLV